jgi:hypothetical protein
MSYALSLPALQVFAPEGLRATRAMAAPPIVLVAPHGTAPLEAAAPLIAPDVQQELAARVADWHDEGSAEAMEAAAAALGLPGFRPGLPRALVDLNRGWKGRQEAKETLFGKGALDAWCSTHLLAGAREAVEGHYRASLMQLEAVSTDAYAFVELHSYGDLGSTYDREAGGRPVRRAECAVVTATPWATAYPVGLARLMPGDLRGTPYAIERAVCDALAVAGFRPGPSPYPTQGPWALSTRFLAARWFGWLAEQGRIGAEAALRLKRSAWHDEQDAEVEAVATGDAPEPDALRGVRELARAMGAWSHDAGELGQRFLAETGTFTLVAELRVDRAVDGAAFGRAIAEGLRAAR